MQITSSGLLYRLAAKQKIPITIEQAWEFLSNPRNLKVITPKTMDFEIILGADKPMFAGQIIEYTVKPFGTFKTHWVTEITQVHAPTYFVDEQRFGPYKLWHHKHFITAIAGGVEMEDVVDFKLPFGWLGKLLFPILVKPKLENIFKYRAKTLEALFGVYNTNFEAP